MNLTHQRAALAGLLVLALLAPFMTVHGSGGFVSDGNWIAPWALHVNYVVDAEAGTIMQTIDAAYRGPYDYVVLRPFGWLIPLPAPPTAVEFDDEDRTLKSLLDTIYYHTEFEILPPVELCAGLVPFWGNCGSGGMEWGEPATTQYEVLTTPDAVQTWITTNDYTLTDQMATLLDEYAAAGWVFLALDYPPTQPYWGFIQNVRITYPGTTPMLPLRLMSQADSTSTVPITVSILADTPYVPANVPHAAINLENINAPVNALTEPFANLGQLCYRDHPTEDRSRSLLIELSRIQHEYDGHAFITRYSGPSSALLDDKTPDSMAALIERYPAVTVFHGQMRPAQMTVDPVFEPDESAPLVSNILDRRAADPIAYWGCSSANALTPDTLAQLPEGRTRVGNIELAHPADWVLSEIELSYTLNPDHIRPDSEGTYTHSLPVLAPEPVTLTTLEAYFAGEPTPPMLIMHFEWAYEWYTLESAYYYDFYYPQDDRTWMKRIRMRYEPFKEVYTEYDAPWVTVLTSEDDWTAHEALYTALLDYAVAHQYEISPDLKHTLFLTHPGSHTTNGYPLARIGYPEGWTAHTLDSFEVWITPDGVQPGDPDAPYLHAIPVYAPPGSEEDMTFIERGARGENLLAQIITTYQLTEVPWTATDLITGACNDKLTTAFQIDNRQGYVSVIGKTYIIEVSAPVEDYPQFAPLLEAMLDAFTYSGCE